MQTEAYVNEAHELDIVDIEAIDKHITFQNCHLVVKYWIEKQPELMEAIKNEYESQIIFGEK